MSLIDKFVDILFLPVVFIFIGSLFLMLILLLFAYLTESELKRKKLMKVFKISLLVTLISLCIGFGLCTQVFNRPGSWS